MKYSIIVPAYNAEKTIERALESVQNQTCSDFEVIMIDDGSRDSTSEICRRFAKTDLRFKYFVQCNKGVSSARNRGILEAKGEYIAFLDSDDEYSNTYLEEFDKLLAEYPEYDHYWCGFAIQSEMSNRKTMQVCSQREDISLVNRCHIMTLHEKWMDSTLWNKIYKRKKLIKHEIFMDETMSLGEDLLFNYEYLNAVGEKIAVINKPNYVYYQFADNTLDSKYRKNLLELYEYIDAELLKWLVRWKVSEEELAKYYNSVFYTQEKILSNTFRKENEDNILKKYFLNWKIMGNAKFKKSFQETRENMHLLYRMAYKSRIYLMVQIVDWLVSIKRSYI